MKKIWQIFSRQSSMNKLGFCDARFNCARWKLVHPIPMKCSAVFQLICTSLNPLPGAFTGSAAAYKYEWASWGDQVVFHMFSIISPVINHCLELISWCVALLGTVRLTLHTLWPPYWDFPQAPQLLTSHASSSSTLSCNQWFTWTSLPLTFSLPRSFVCQ